MTEMDLYDAMHPRCRKAIADCPFHFDLTSMSKTALNLAIGAPRPSPGRFIRWLNGEIEAVRLRESHAGIT